MNVEKIVSGGQTGVDRAALDAALACGLPVGGWCPKGRRAEDGVIDARYPLEETPSRAYEQRTAWNVRDSDGTLVLLFEAPIGGTAFTIKEAERQGKPLREVYLKTAPEVEKTRAWMAREDVSTLNVAGPRESEAPGIYEESRSFLEALLCEGEGS